MLVRVQLGYKPVLLHKKNPASLENTGFLKVRSTGLEFVWIGFAFLCRFSDSLYFQWFPPSVVMCFYAVLFSR